MDFPNFLNKESYDLSFQGYCFNLYNLFKSYYLYLKYSKVIQNIFIP